jgi:dTDP-glucose pyrophosphorylase
MNRPSELYVTTYATIRSAVAAIDRSRKIGLALVVDEHERLLNTLTDGDVRRGLLAGVTLDAPVARLLDIKRNTPHPTALTAPKGSAREVCIALMHQHGVRQLPLMDDAGRVEEIITLEPQDICEADLSAVVMAGGFGKRLHPLTENTPKPMLLVGGKPILEILVQQLRESGIRDFHFTTHYRPEKIREHFGDGSNFGININYLNEESPLGTAGALSLLPVPQADKLVINGDVLTQLDFARMFCFHRQRKAAMTVAVREYEHVVPFGVVRIDDALIRTIEEKPRHFWFVNAGIYILSPRVFDHIRRGERLDMPELIQRLIVANQPVASFPIREKWTDIGRHGDYEAANREAHSLNNG